MAMHVNPFHDLYLTETIDPGSFVKVFSPLLVSDTLPLFQPGNVILRGVQGSGKSMLLALFKPEVRIAYAVAAQDDFPVPNEFSRFIGAGINLTRSVAIDFGQRPIEPELNDEFDRIPAYFGDFLNYWIVRDLLQTIDKLREAADGRVAEELGLKTNSSIMDDFAIRLARKPCWFGFLDDIRDYKSLHQALVERIVDYRSFLNYNAETLSERIRTTKTSIGEPVSITAETLRESEIVPEEVPFFIRIDQFEELYYLEDWSKEQNLYQSFRAVVIKMLGTRDPRVSYRIGTRQHAWLDLPRMHGTSAVIEELRNFKDVDFDDILRRREHNRPWPFKNFAEDVFQRRIERAQYKPRKHLNNLRPVFGPRILPRDKARLTATKSRQRVVKVERDWPAEVKDCLKELAKKDPLSAKLGEAWVRQQMNREEPVLPKEDFFPWEGPIKKWWKKERINQALLQIAAASSQKMIWLGKEDILALSGGNILVFLSLCQYIWSVWLRSSPQEATDGDEKDLPEIHDQYIQNDGIQEASSYWYRKILTDSGGNGRQRFISHLGKILYLKLRDDKRMSYPGRNGFSVPVGEFADYEDVLQHLTEAVAFGSLVSRRHTPKNRTRGESRKWYLQPILSPYFQIPVSHTKEPMYVHVSDVRKWLEEAKVLWPKPKKKPKPKHKKPSSKTNIYQPSLFDSEDKE